MNTGLILAALLAAQDSSPEAAPVAATMQAHHGAEAASATVAYPAAFFQEYQVKTARDMLNRLPGFDTSDGGGGRGLGQGGNVLIDGDRPTSKSDSLDDILGRLQASSVERIDLIRGSAPGVDMQGYSVVANVIRKRGGGLKGSVAGHLFSTGGEGGYQLEGQGQRDFGDHILSGSFEIRDAADPRETGDRLRTDAGGALLVNSERSSVEYGEDYSGTLSYEGSAGPGRLRATLVARNSSDEERSTERELAPTPGPPELDEGGGSDRHREVDLSYTWPVTGLGEAQATLVAQKNRNESRSYFGASTFSQIRESSEVVGLGALRLSPIGRWTIDGGLEVAFNTLDTSSVLTGVGTSLPNPQITVEELRGEAFGAARFAFSPRLNLEFGLRYERSRISTAGAAPLEKTLSFPKPRFLATFARSDDEQLSLRIEREVDQLSFGDFSASVSLSNGSAPIAGNPDLEPGRAWVIQGAYERRFGRQGVFVVEITHEELEAIIATNVFLLAPAPPVPTPLVRGTYYEAADNIGDGTRDSIEVEATVPLDRIGLKGGLLTTSLEGERTRIIDPTTGERRPFSGSSPFEWSLDLSQDIAGLDLRWIIQASSEAPSDGFRPTEISYDAEDPSINVSVEKTLGKIWIKTGVNNVTGAESNSRRTVYDNPRGRGAVRFNEARRESETPFYYFLVRRTF